MAMRFEEMIQAIEKVAPKYLQENWDNSGVQIAVNDGMISRVLITLEITDEIIQGSF